MSKIDQILKIEQILADSPYDSYMFSKDQIIALCKMVDDGIDISQINIIANPVVSELSYKVLANYLKKNTITQSEYNKYLVVDESRVNDIIINVYLGKMHGLTDDQVDLYANKQCKHIEQSRNIVEKCKDIPENKLHIIVDGKCNFSDSEEGKILLEKFIEGTISVDKILAISNFSIINSKILYDLMTGDERLIKLYADANSKRDASINNTVHMIHIIYKLTPDYKYKYDHYICSFYKSLITSKLKFESTQDLISSLHELSYTEIQKLLNNSETGIVNDAAEFIQDTLVEAFNNSPYFKAINYDETIIVNIKNEAETHVMTFTKKDDGIYHYLFEFDNNKLHNHEAIVRTKQNVINAIHESIENISYIYEYKVFTQELNRILFKCK